MHESIKTSTHTRTATLSTTLYPPIFRYYTLGFDLYPISSLLHKKTFTPETHPLLSRQPLLHTSSHLSSLRTYLPNKIGFKKRYGWIWWFLLLYIRLGEGRQTFVSAWRGKGCLHPRLRGKCKSAGNEILGSGRGWIREKVGRWWNGGGDGEEWKEEM